MSPHRPTFSPIHSNMRPLLVLSAALLLSACRSEKPMATADAALVPAAEPAAADTRPAAPDLKRSVVRLNSTRQSWNPGQPWEKNPPARRRALAAIVGPGQVLTTSEMVADATFLEFESPDGTRFAQAKVVAVDYEANLALLEASDSEQASRLFEDTVPLEMTSPPKLGDTLEILQIEDNGVPLVTSALLQSIDVSPNFLPGHSFLTYLVKASMQSAASSYSLPVLHQGQLAGVLISYNSNDQICDVAATDIIARFLQEAAEGNYRGFPSLGVSFARTEDTSFREWLKLEESDGGIYINKVRKGGAAESAGVKDGDVLLALDGKPIDRRGYYEHPHYGSLFWGHLVRGAKSTGDTVNLALLRDGERIELSATLTREEEQDRIVPNYRFDAPPNYLVKGGLVFQELSRPLLEAFGEDWTTRAPLNLLDAYENPEQYEGKTDRIVFLSGSIATPATVGYERLRNLIVRRVNGREIRNMKNLVDAFAGNLQELHSIEFAEEDFTVYLDDAVSSAVDAQLLERGITRLYRTD
jgi:S1-C subfamily serine protease